ncbi:hypothetical protein [Providencia rettgeri]|uniref:hypothetical protein n=1 Tax=Providencia rettgeri TaxID=587 RepID=UPI0023AAD18E|nr:hypothetical protein [Providencia rettgeri]
MKRKSISIKNKKIINYIEETSDLIGISESEFLEYILSEKIENDIKSKKTKKETRDKSSFFKQIFELNSGISYMYDFKLYETTSILVNGLDVLDSFGNIKQTSLKKTAKNYITNEIKKTNFYITDSKIPDVIINNKKEIIKDDFVSLTLIDISEISIARNDREEKEKTKILDNLHEKVKSSLIKNKDNNEKLIKIINDEYQNLNKDINKMLAETFFLLDIRYDWWQIPIIIDDDLNPKNRFYDYLNIRYNAFRNFKQHHETKNKFIVLLKCKYGFFSCDIFDEPMDAIYYRNKLYELKNKTTIRNNPSSFIQHNNIIKFPPDSPTVNKGSRLLRKMIKIIKTKEKIIQNIGSKKFNLDTTLNSRTPNFDDEI